jgi:putative nucleotidyltransferase with HDIG domain
MEKTEGTKIKKEKVVKKVKDSKQINSPIANNELLARLSNLLLEAHEYTAKHSSRVVKFAVTLAKKKKLGELEIEKIRVAAELHDIGKLGIGQDILNKPSKLTKSEFDMVKKHPEIALKLLKELSFIIDVVNMVYYHHERFDGTGYPEKLKGDAIPLGARIVAIADAYDAMTSDRVYAKAMPIKDAIEELKRCKGTQFDAELIDLFIETVNE